jgi:hypothetical protein
MFSGYRIISEEKPKVFAIVDHDESIRMHFLA